MPLAATHADELRFESLSVELTHLRAVGTIPGVAVLAVAAANGPGVGQIRSVGDGTRLTWLAPGSAVFGTPVSVSADGLYLLEDGEDRNKWCRVQVFNAHLTPGPDQASVYMRGDHNTALADADVTDAQALAGDVSVFTVSMANHGNVVLSHLAVWIDPAVSGLEISDDGVVWVAPTTESAALAFPDLVPGGSHTLHLRRTITAASPSATDVLNHIHARYDGL